MNNKKHVTSLLLSLLSCGGVAMAGFPPPTPQQAVAQVVNQSSNTLGIQSTPFRLTALTENPTEIVAQSQTEVKDSGNALYPAGFTVSIGQGAAQCQFTVNNQSEVSLTRPGDGSQGFQCSVDGKAILLQPSA
jgi:hypothetical protein